MDNRWRTSAIKNWFRAQHARQRYAELAEAAHILGVTIAREIERGKTRVNLLFSRLDRENAEKENLLP